MEWFKTWCTRPTWQQLRRCDDGGYRLFYEARYHLSLSESTDGRISSEQLCFLGPSGTLHNAAALVTAGLWTDDPSDGWQDVTWALEQDEMGRAIRRKQGARERQQKQRTKQKATPLAPVTDLSRVTSRESHAHRREEKREEKALPALAPIPTDFRAQFEAARQAAQESA